MSRNPKQPVRATPKPKRRWFQFSLRTLPIFVALCAIPSGSWLAVKMQQAKRQRAAVAAIEELDGSLRYDYQYDAPGNGTQAPEPAGPAWLRRLLGDDFFTAVFYVSLVGTQVTDAGLENLKGLNQLQMLDLNGTKITDAGLENLEGLVQLEELYINGTQVTDAGKKKLQQALPKCQIFR